MPTLSATELAPATIELAQTWASSAGTPPQWAERFQRAIDPDETATLHVAVFAEPWLGWILDGSKTVESRFSAVRSAPWNAVSEGDVVLMKQTSGPIVGAFSAGFVSSYVLDAGDLDSIEELFGDAICPDGPEFWSDRVSSKYATLVGIDSTLSLEPRWIPKRDRHGWVVVQSPALQSALL